jgi:hypothetical protein
MKILTLIFKYSMQCIEDWFAKSFDDNIGLRWLFGLKMSILTPVIFFIEKYVFNDWGILISVFMMLLIDGGAMLMRVIWGRNFKAETAMAMFAKNSLSIAVVIFSTSVMDLARLKGAEIESLAFFHVGIYVIIFSYLLASIMTNVYGAFQVELIRQLIEKFNIRRNKNDNFEEDNPAI